MASGAHKGGQKADPFVFTHFSAVGKRDAKTKRWSVQCKYCTAPPIVHRDSHCLSHLGKEGVCPNAPANVKIEARRLLMKKGGIEIAEPDSDGETMSLVNAEYVAGSSTNPTAKKVKVMELGDRVLVSGKRTLDAYLDRTMTVDFRKISNGLKEERT